MKCRACGKDVKGYHQFCSRNCAEGAYKELENLFNDVETERDNLKQALSTLKRDKEELIREVSNSNLKEESRAFEIEYIRKVVDGEVKN